MEVLTFMGAISAALRSDAWLPAPLTSLCPNLEIPCPTNALCNNRSSLQLVAPKHAVGNRKSA